VAGRDSMPIGMAADTAHGDAPALRRLSRYGGINEDFVLVDGWGECEAEGSQEIVEGVGKALV
jgi:hypothetical protein